MDSNPAYLVKPNSASLLRMAAEDSSSASCKSMTDTGSFRAYFDTENRRRVLFLL